MPDLSPPRLEQQIFDELGELCVSPGYIHVIAFFSFRDQMVRYSGEMKPEDMQHLFSASRLIRTEIATLIGLSVKQSIDDTLPDAETMQTVIRRTEELLEELHRSMSIVYRDALKSAQQAGSVSAIFSNAAAMREPIFYSGEAGYGFQYRDFAPPRYARDHDWILANKGFTIEQASLIARHIGELAQEKLAGSGEGWNLLGRKADRSYLPGYTFSAMEIVARTRLELNVVRNILKAFALPTGETNAAFRSLNEFNAVSAYPLISMGEDTFILFHIYSLVEAIYDSPFYWMSADVAYHATAMEHRGLFAEEFSAQRLAIVFGPENVYTNIEIRRGKERYGEIDVLVLFANRAIVLQAKSKRLTLEARKGNDLQLKSDFKKSVQDAYDQGHRCAEAFGDAKFRFFDRSGSEIEVPANLKRIHILCVLSDHYPALSFQVRNFLKHTASSRIPAPFALDLFTLDTLVEMLRSPLHFMSYLDRRTQYDDKVLASHEITILAYHLKQNLWFDDEYGLVMLSDDISAELDLAMSVRRDGVKGKPTPEGLLTRLPATTAGRLLEEIEANPDPRVLELGFMLLTLSEDTIIALSDGLDTVRQRTLADGKLHDFSIGLDSAGDGLTVHCNPASLQVASERLEMHCHGRKYKQKAQRWFGLCIEPNSGRLMCGINLDFEWTQDDDMDEFTRDLGQGKASPSGSDT